MEEDEVEGEVILFKGFSETNQEKEKEPKILQKQTTVISKEIVIEKEEKKNLTQTTVVSKEVVIGKEVRKDSSQNQTTVVSKEVEVKKDSNQTTGLLKEQVVQIKDNEVEKIETWRVVKVSSFFTFPFFFTFFSFPSSCFSIIFLFCEASSVFCLGLSLSTFCFPSISLFFPSFFSLF